MFMTQATRANDSIRRMLCGELTKEQAIQELIGIGLHPALARERVFIALGGSDVRKADSQEEIDRILASEAQ